MAKGTKGAAPALIEEGVMARSAEQVSADLMAAPLQIMVCLDGSFGGIQLLKSVADPRVIVKIVSPKKGNRRKVYLFSDDADAVDVDISENGPIITDCAHEFATFQGLCEAIAAHDTALADARDWRDAAPEGGAP